MFGNMAKKNHFLLIALLFSKLLNTLFKVNIFNKENVNTTKEHVLETRDFLNPRSFSEEYI